MKKRAIMSCVTIGTDRYSVKEYDRNKVIYHPGGES